MANKLNEHYIYLIKIIYSPVLALDIAFNCDYHVESLF